MAKLSLGYQVLAAVVLAIIVGLFFGPLCIVLKPIAMCFTMLLQLLVLPYICFSLIHGLGSLAASTGRKLFKCGWLFLLSVWLLVYFLMVAVSLLIPDPLETLIKTYSSEAKSSLLEEFIRYIIPENLLYDMANNIVPAVAVFALIAGVTLMHLEKKEPLIGFLDRIVKLIEKALYWLALISPIGAFAHVAIAVGTVRFEDLYKIEFFLICYIGLSLFITLVVLPLIVSSLTPMRYKEVLRAIRKVCLLPFVTGLSSLSIPFINSYLKEVSRKYQDPKFQETSQTILPLVYSFGQIGNCIVLFFLFFLSFYYRQPFSPSQEGLLALLSIPLSIGTNSNTINSVAFMIEHLHLPAEGFLLFTETSVITMNFQVLMSIAAVLCLILLIIHSYHDALEIKWKPLLFRLGGTIVAFSILLLSIKPLITISDNYKNLYGKLKITDVIPNPVKAEVLTNAAEGTPRTPGIAPIEQVIESRILKVGFDSPDAPYSYMNDQGQLVGYDIAYAYELARDLDCTLQFIPSDFNRLHLELEAGYYDIVMSAILMTEDRLIELNFTHPYQQESIVLVVPYAKKNRFLHLSDLVKDQEITIGAIGSVKQYAYRHFPNAKIVQFDELSLLDKPWMIDAWIVTLKNGFIWCLSHPDYVTIDYGGLIGSAYFSYPVKEQGFKFISFLNNWLMLKQISGFHDKMVDYWFEGNRLKKKEPRWSILRNVLHVGE